MNTQDKEKLLQEAFQYFWIKLDGDAFKWQNLTDEMEAQYREALKEKLKEAFNETLSIFLPDEPKPDDPKPGEWWYVKVGDTNVVPIRIKAINQQTGEYVCEGSNWLGHTVYQPKKREELTAKLPPTFPRLSRLIGRLRDLLLSIRLG